MASAYEQRVRRIAKRYGYTVTKSRQQPHRNNGGAFMLVQDGVCVVLGYHYDASLEEIEAWLQGEA